LSQYVAQTAGVIELEEVEAETRARPFVPSAIRLEEAAAKPAGSAPTEMTAAAEDAAGAADDEG
jgi:hypothetical protein